MVIGTLSHAKVILQLLLQNDKAKAFSEGGKYLPPPEGETPSTSPLTLIKNEGEEKKGKGIFLKLEWLTLLRRNLNLI